jgi:glycerol-3-phosphate O-acyltransferase
LFVPVALNYDRVLEDRILMAADAAGTRRFRARISVVAGFFFKQLWLRVIGRFHRFGYAAVSFGSPVSLRAHAKTHGNADAERLGEELMQRIADVVPIVPVPLLASVMKERESVVHADLPMLMQSQLDRMKNAYVHMPRDNIEYASEIALKHLCERRILRIEGDTVVVDDAQRFALRYYANTIEHLAK